MAVWFDHLVIGAADLDAGAAWAAETLGATPPIGGAHPLMATHNRLARLPAGYLEIIAVDPDARPATARRRWYGLDDPSVQARIKARPRPIAFVLATDDLASATASAPWDAGDVIEASRGDLTWLMAIRPDGGVAEGVLPVLIEWPASLGKRAPVDRMAELGLALRELRLKHPEPERIKALLAGLDAEQAMIDAGAPLTFVQDETPSIEAMFTPARFDTRR